ncbi:hypothetical protein AYK26_01845 [Euryarchaeota archaeon SM23-78]|nr:MAG: hypothetical protein AYK26_01845 [Euryarchaeota archaeon SM23-78]MBW3000340.1 hypothetical protein [Candidatus Woesearchaeota archaeon]
MNKRGASWSLLQTLTIVMGIVAAVFLVSIVYRYTSQDRAEQGFLSKDSAMLVDAMLSTPQDIQLVHKEDLMKGYIRLGNSSIAVFPSQPSRNQSAMIKDSFVPRKDIVIEKKDLKLTALFFIKEGSILRIDNRPARDMPEEENEE